MKRYVAWCGIAVVVCLSTGLAGDEPPAPRTSADMGAALQWLAAQQHQDGGWAFAAEGKPDDKAAKSSTQATGLALLAMLSAGQTHKEGDCRKQVHGGLSFLIKSMKLDEDKKTADLRGTDGDLISHAIATTALCEAYSMTHDKELLTPAQLAVNFIVAAQEKDSGGWRGDPMAAPTMEVLGWQLTALRCGHMAYLQVPAATVTGTGKYLDKVQLEGGRYYPDEKGKRHVRATAIALWCRLILGWKPDRPEFVDGSKFVNDQAPAVRDIVFDYFTHQGQHNSRDESISTRRAEVQRQLLQAQQTQGPQAGSWFDPRDANAAQGRLYQTAFSVLILQNLRRRILVKPAADDDGFPL